MSIPFILLLLRQLKTFILKMLRTQHWLSIWRPLIPLDITYPPSLQLNEKNYKQLLKIHIIKSQMVVLANKSEIKLFKFFSNCYYVTDYIISINSCTNYLKKKVLPFLLLFKNNLTCPYLLLFFDFFVRKFVETNSRLFVSERVVGTTNCGTIRHYSEKQQKM